MQHVTGYGPQIMPQLDVSVFNIVNMTSQFLKWTAIVIISNFIYYKYKIAFIAVHLLNLKIKAYLYANSLICEKH